MQKVIQLVSLCVAGAVAAPSFTLQARQASSGTGPYPAAYTTDTTLTAHTIYAPKTPPANVKLPVLVWGNGGCSANGASQSKFLTQVASYGFLVIASGAPNGAGQTTSKMMKDSIDWAVSRPNDKYHEVLIDSSLVAAAGYSCGGIEAYDQQADARVKTLGIFNSGLLQNTANIAKNNKPTFYFLGGSTDIAYQNGERDYKGLPAGVASWKGNLPTGHGATYNEANGGKFAIAAVHWLQFVLQGNSTAAQFFKGSGAATDGWAVESKNLDKLS